MKLVLGWALLGLGGLIAAGNARLFWRSFVRKEERSPSMTPLVGGLLGAAGAALLFGGRWAWLPPLLDAGCLFYLYLPARAAAGR